jgi:hypothetical protein
MPVAVAQPFRRLVIGLAAFCSLTAIAGAVELVVWTKGNAYLPIALLEPTPFATFLVPGLLLGLVVGGSSLACAILSWRRASAAVDATLLAGGALSVWIFVESAMLNDQSWLQVLYGTLGVMLFGLGVLAARGSTVVRHREIWHVVVRVPLLALAHVVLFSVGGALFAPTVGSGPQTPTGGFGAVVGMALLDSALVLAVVRSSRLSGAKLMGLVTVLFYFVKTLTSQIEAAYLMPNVVARMLPGLLAMTVPLAVGIGPLAVLIGGRSQPTSFDRSPGFIPLPTSTATALARGAVLSVFVYPALFFAAGWFIAFGSPEVRAFHGGAHGDGFLPHLLGVFDKDPFLYLLEVLRGALWVLFALPLLRTTRGPGWLGTLHVAAWLALVQNDMLFIPNPLMTPNSRFLHFVETVSFNAVWAVAIGWVMTRPPRCTRAVRQTADQHGPQVSDPKQFDTPSPGSHSLTSSPWLPLPPGQSLHDKTVPDSTHPEQDV